MKFRVNRTEFSTRVFEVEAETEEEALEKYSEEGRLREEFHFGDPQVEVIEEGEDFDN